MDLFSDLRTAVQDDLNVDDNSTLYPPALIDRAINRSYRKAGGLFFWPGTEDAKKTSTQNGVETYDYPKNWRSESIWRIEIDDVRWGEKPDGSPLAFLDYLDFKHDSPDSDVKKWSSQKRRYFITPTPSATGSNDISVWGQKIVDALSDDGDITIFSFSLIECNDAVVLETVAILKSKGEKEKSGEFRSTEAKQILAGAWSKIKADQSKYEKTHPFFNVPDFYATGAQKTKIGDFVLRD